MSKAQKLKKSVALEINTTISLKKMKPIETHEELAATWYRVDGNTNIIAYDFLLDGRNCSRSIKIASNKLSIVTIGDVHSRLLFQEGEKQLCQYFHAGSSLVMQSFTKRLDYAISPDSMMIDLLYELWIGDDLVNQYLIEFYLK